MFTEMFFPHNFNAKKVNFRAKFNAYPILSVSALHISFGCHCRIKLECIVRILSVSRRWISHSGVNQEQA